MIQKNEHRLGYKKMKVGWIPEEWECSVFGAAFHIQLGKMLNKKARNDADQAPYLANVNVRWGGFDLSKVRTMGFSDREKEKFALREGDLLVCEGGEIGRCAIWRAEITPCFYQKALHRLRAKNEDVCPFFAMSFLHKVVRSPRMRGYIGETSIAHFTKERFLSFPIPLPPLPEQEAIAGVLQCWDRGIENLELKIVKKRNVKKGLMQALLSGKIRLPGFGTTEDTEEHGKGRGGIPEGWKEVRLGSSGSFSKGKGIAKDDVSETGLPCIRYGQIYTTDAHIATQLPSCIGPELVKQSTRIGYNDLLLAGSGETIDEIGKSLAYMGTEKAYAGGDIVIFSAQADVVRADYLAYYLNTEGRRSVRRLGQGQSVVHVYARDLMNVIVPLPAVKEQQAIAAVISDADTEVEVLERKLAALKDQKRFLLNNLVTGSLRLPEFAATENTESHGNEKHE
jgi:type I restriction enzyme S subunit